MLKKVMFLLVGGFALFGSAFGSNIDVFEHNKM